MAGADPNTVDDEGETVLHRAVAKKHIECAIVILENGGCRSMGILNAKELTYVFSFFQDSLYKLLDVVFSCCLF